MAKATGALAKLKISWGDIAYIVGYSIPALRAQWPGAKDALKNLADTNPDVAAFVENIENIYKKITS